MNEEKYIKAIDKFNHSEIKTIEEFLNFTFSDNVFDDSVSKEVFFEWLNDLQSLESWHRTFEEDSKYHTVNCGTLNLTISYDICEDGKNDPACGLAIDFIEANNPMEENIDPKHVIRVLENALRFLKKGLETGKLTSEQEVKYETLFEAPMVWEKDYE